jgi:uncharacterized protein YaaR (DUF327 family)
VKIRNVNRTESGANTAHGTGALEGSAIKSIIFKKTLSDMSSRQRQSHINSLIKKIDEQGEKLGNKADIREFEMYRKLIRSFIEEVLSFGYEYSKESAYGYRGRHRFYATVKIIDEKLDALAKEILKEQKDNIAILNNIGEIKGLLLDLLV